MSARAQLEDLSRRLTTREARGRAYMVVPITPGAGASFICARLAANAARESARPVWLFDLDFGANPQSTRTRMNGAAYSADLGAERFWRTEPEGAGRLALRKVDAAPVLISVFERDPGEVRRVTFASAPAYWDRVRDACGLALIDIPCDSPAATALCADVDGVILVGDAKTTTRAMADSLADEIEHAGGEVLGVILNRAPEQATR
ncbi:hypothetical protein [Marinicauda sp. Alg238-R41]|jgi:hypothetical protein|nr:hypothetical protein [Marinicauda sp. Alg238-R41]